MVQKKLVFDYLPFLRTLTIAVRKYYILALNLSYKTLILVEDHVHYEPQACNWATKPGRIHQLMR